MVGRTLLHYRVLEKIGAGGMGEVYRALDTKLNREVAIKLLPEAFADSPERIARLRREAQLLAALNHPNIAAVYDLEQADGQWLLVLELVPGRTLAEWLQKGPLPLPQALSVSQQIAEALEAAHEKGIIHRDLKPANVKITPEGQVKLLDFGLAKVNAVSADSADQTSAQTQAEFTEPGLVLGTVAYMSPEQARGEPVDRRSDIWAFGCVLYEALTSRRLFAGKTASDTMAEILRGDPKLEGLPATTPPSVRILLERCLRHDRTRRLRDVGDARIELEDGRAAAPPPPPTRATRGAVWMLAGVLLGSIVFGAAWWQTRPRQEPAPSVQFQRLTDSLGIEESPALSPDGKTVAFVAPAGGRRHIWVRLLAGGVPLRITHDDADHQAPRWAPDSSSLIYYSPSATPGEQGTIREVSALGGAPRRVAAALSGGDISHDGRRIVLFRERGEHTELAVVARDGSSVNVVKQLAGDAVYDSPRWSPDNRAIAYQRLSNAEYDARVYVASAAGGEPRQVARSDNLRGIAWRPDSSGLVFSSSLGSTLLYPPIFNLRTVARDGTGERQLTFGDASYVEPDVHASGKLLATRVKIRSNIWKYPVTGSVAENVRAGVRITNQTGQAQTPSSSPDDKDVVYLSDSGGHANLWVARTDGSGIRQITSEHGPTIALGIPLWSPAGNEIAFLLTREGSSRLSLIHPDGSGLREIVPRGGWASWSGDGRWLYYVPSRSTTYSVEKVSVDGGTPLSVRRDNAGGPAPSPDGSTLYFVTPLKRGGAGWDWEVRKARPEDGPSEILARIAGSRVPVNPFLIQPTVSPDGKWIALPLIDGVTTNLWALPTEGGSLQKLTDFGDWPIIIGRRVAWSPDGQHIYAAVAELDADVVLLDGLLR